MYFTSTIKKKKKTSNFVGVLDFFKGLNYLNIIYLFYKFFIIFITKFKKLPIKIII